MANQELEILVKIVNQTRAEMKSIKQGIAGLQPELQKATAAATQSRISFGELAGSFTVGNLAARAITNGLTMMANAITGVIGGFIEMGFQAARIEELEFAMNVMAQQAGLVVDDVFDVRDSITDLNISNKQATQFIIELTRANIDLSDSTGLVRGAQDLAVISGMDSAEALGRLSKALRTGNTMILDQLVNLPNLNIIYRQYASTIDKTSTSLTQAEKSQAIVNAFMGEAGKVTGLYEAALQGASKGQRSFNSAITRTKENLGRLLVPALDAIVGEMLGFAKEMEEFTKNNEDQIRRAGAAIGQSAKEVVNAISSIIHDIPWGTLAGILGAIVNELARVAHWAGVVYNTVKAAFQGLTALGQAITGVIGAGVEALQGNFEGAMAQMNVAGEAISKKTEDISKTFDNMWEHAKTSQSKFTDRFKQRMKEATIATRKELNLQKGNWDNSFDEISKGTAKKIKDLVRKMSNEMRKFGRSMEKATKGFQQRLDDLVLRHRDRIKDLRSDMDGLARTWKEDQLEMTGDYEERVEDIKGSAEEEIEALKENLGRQLAQRHRADEDLVAALEVAIAEKEAKRDEELAKEEIRFQKEVEKAKKAHEERVSEVQKQLNVELEIQKKHQEDFDRLKDKAVEDDITRLKNSFADEMAERRLQHEERMEELKRQFDEIQRVKSSGNKSIGARAPIQRAGETKPAFSPVGGIGSTSAGGEWKFTGRDWERAGSGVVVNQTNNIREEVDMSVAFRELGWMLATA